MKLLMFNVRVFAISSSCRLPRDCSCVQSLEAGASVAHVDHAFIIIIMFICSRIITI